VEEEGGGFNEGGMWRRREGGLMKVVWAPVQKVELQKVELQKVE